jgi:ribonuclease HI
MMENSTKECMQHIISITYSIWLARNKRVFQNINTPVLVAIDSATRALHDYQQHLKANPINSTSIQASKASSNIRRSPPPRQNLTLSVDAHHSDDGHWGFGFILRRMDGLCVGAATKLTLGSGTVELAETNGLREALDIIEKNNLHQVSILMDAACIVQAINNKTFPRSQGGQLARVCTRAMERLNGVTLAWIPRRENEAAHTLARLAKTEPNMYWTSNFPFCIKDLVLIDKAIVT